MTKTTHLYCPKTDNSHAKHGCEVELLFEELGLRRSKDRHNLVELLSQKRTWSISELLDASHHTDRSTIYRNIEVFLTHGIIQPVQVSLAETRYEWAIGNHHDHNTCTECKTVDCIPCPIPKVKDHRLELSKLCKACK